MALHIVLDGKSNERFEYSPAIPSELRAAVLRFEKLVLDGFVAFDKHSGRRLIAFEPAVAMTIFTPDFKGGQ